MSPAMAHIHKQIESSQMDSLLLTEARGAGGSGGLAAAAGADGGGDKASIQSELDGIRAHLTSLLQQMAHTGGGQDDEAHVEESAPPSHFQSSAAKMPPPHLTAVERTDSTDSIPDFRGRRSGDLEGLLSSTYYAAGGQTAREESLNLRQQVLSLQKKVEEQALKFSVTKADSSFLTEVLAQKDKILNECQLLLIELDARYQGVADRCAMLEATLQQKDDRICELEVLAGVRKAGGQDVGGGGGGDGRAAAQQDSEEMTKTKTRHIKRRNSHKKLIQWVGMDTARLQEKTAAMGADSSGGGGGVLGGGGGDIGVGEGSAPAPSYSNLMDKLSELQVQLRTSPLRTAANVATVAVRLKRRSKMARQRLEAARESAARREPGSGSSLRGGGLREGEKEVLSEKAEEEVGAGEHLLET